MRWYHNSRITRNTYIASFKLADKYIGAEKREVKECEFDVYAALEFNLFLPKSEFMPHFDRLGNFLGRASMSSKSTSSSR